MSHSDLILFYDKILKSNGIFGRIKKIAVDKPLLKGEHMASSCELITINLVEEGKELDLQLFVKKTLEDKSENGNGNFIADEHNVMIKEGIFLLHFTKEMQNFCIKRTGNDEILQGIFPKAYYFDKNCVIMEDLIAKDFSMIDKFDGGHDFQQAKNVLETLSRFNAITYLMILEYEREEENSFIKKFSIFKEILVTQSNTEMLNQLFEPVLNAILNSILKLEFEKKTQVFNKLKEYKGSIFDTFFNAMWEYNLFNVVSHGDFYNNNLLLAKDDSSTTNSKVTFVDFQLTRLGSPNLDICNYLFTSVKSHVRKRWKELLEFYFENLNLNITKLKGEPLPFALDEFFLDFEKKSKLGYLSGILISFGVEALRDFDVEKETSNKSFAENYSTNVSNWIENNPFEVETLLSNKITCMTRDILDIENHFR